MLFEYLVQKQMAIIELKLLEEEEFSPLHGDSYLQWKQMRIKILKDRIEYLKDLE